ncbi:hypothetical protein [Synechococcus phage DSL-LC03]|nr:hypothetical protein [Synechococcus phage DSL-LC03]
MPTALKIIFDEFTKTYLIYNKMFKNDRDAMIDLYLYFSMFMDKEIKEKRNKYDKTTYINLKKLGLRYIKQNPKDVLSYLKSK